MEFIIIRHAQSEHNVGRSKNLDSDITGCGEGQAHRLAEYLATNNLVGFQGIVSPYLRTLRTAEIIHRKTGIPFEVSGGVREYHIDKSRLPPGDEGMTLPNRSVDYPHFAWDFSSPYVFYANEHLEEFIQRIKLFLKTLRDGKYLIVSHGAPTRVLHECATGADLEYLTDRYNEERLRCEPPADGSSIRNCSLTHIANGESKVFARELNENVSRLDTNQRGTGDSKSQIQRA